MTEMIIRVLDTLRLCFRRTIYKLPYSNKQRRLMHHVLFITACFFHFLSLTIYFHFKTRKKQTQNKKQISADRILSTMIKSWWSSLHILLYRQRFCCCFFMCILCTNECVCWCILWNGVYIFDHDTSTTTTYQNLFM